MSRLHQRWPAVRVVLLLGSAILLLAVSWGWLRATTPGSEAAPELAVDAAGRAGSSTDQLIDNLQRRAQAQPADWQVLSQLGAAYLQKARETGDPTYYAKAEGVLSAALQQEPGDYAAVSAMGELALTRHDFRGALAWGQRAHDLNPQRTYAYGVIADAQIELGRYDEAVVTLQQMVDLRPDLSSFSRISYLRELNGDLDGAREAMQWAVEAGGPYAENTQWTHVQLGHLYFDSGRLPEAEEQYQQALAMDPGYLHAQAGLARVRAAQGQFEAAIALYSQVVERMPLPDYVIALGDVYSAAGRPQEARRQYELVRAIQQLYRANGVDVDLEMTLFEADHGGAPQALVAQARLAYERRPSVHGADVLAWALYRAGAYGEGATYSEEALRLGTQDALMLYHAGMIADRMGEGGQARGYLERALTINPHFSLLQAGVARQALEKLRGRMR